MNNSALKSLITRKGFAYGRSSGAVVLVKPDDPRVHHLTQEYINWLENFPDVITPKNRFTGVYIGDQVQAFWEGDEYEYWGKVGRVTGLENRGEEEFVKLFISDVDGKIEVPKNCCTVLNREGEVDLQGMSTVEREAAVLKMMGLPIPEPGQLPSCICECNESCLEPLLFGEWEIFDHNRKEMGMADKWFIISKDCNSLGHGETVVDETETLVMVEYGNDSLVM